MKFILFSCTQTHNCFNLFVYKFDLFARYLDFVPKSNPVPTGLEDFEDSFEAPSSTEKLKSAVHSFMKKNIEKVFRQFLITFILSETKFSRLIKDPKTDESFLVNNCLLF